MYVMDPWWNPAAEEQAIDRAHRIGQTKKVNVYRLVATDTIEAKVVELQDRKRRLISSVMSGTGRAPRSASPTCGVCLMSRDRARVAALGVRRP